MDRFGREHQVMTVLKPRIDVTKQHINIQETKKRPECHLLAVTIARNNATVERIQQTSQLPSSSATLSVSEQALLCNYRHCISRRSVQFSEDFVPNVSLILFLEDL